MPLRVWHLRNASSPAPLQVLTSLLTGVALLASSVCPPVAFGGLSDQNPSDGVRQTPPSSDPAEASHVLDPATLKIPERLGHLVETFVPDSKPGTRHSKLIIHLQDVHTELEAQHALADLIHELHRLTGVSLVTLEGGGRAWRHEFFLVVS